MSDTATLPDIAQSGTTPPELTLIVPGPIPGSSSDEHARHRLQRSAENAVTPADSDARNSTAVPDDNDTESLLERFHWQTAKPSDSDTDSGLDTDSASERSRFGHLDEPWECILLRHTGAPAILAGQLPIAQLRWPLDMPAGQALPQHIVCADPVHLQVDRDSISVIPPQALSITREEADACASSINALLREDGLEVVVATPENWYLTGADAAGLSAAPTHAVARRTVATSIADDEAASRWRQRTSELQMLLHSHEVNAARQGRGLLPINSVWFFGGERLPAASLQSKTLRVYSDDALALALAKALGMATGSLAHLNAEPASTGSEFGTAPAGGDAVWVDLSLYRAWLGGNPEQIDAARSALVRRVIGPALDQLDSGCVSRVSIDAGDGLHGVARPPARKRSVFGSIKHRFLTRLGLATPIDRDGR